jgi:hypothetical protein
MNYLNYSSISFANLKFVSRVSGLQHRKKQQKHSEKLWTHHRGNAQNLSENLQEQIARQQ